MLVLGLGLGLGIGQTVRVEGFEGLRVEGGQCYCATALKVRVWGVWLGKG